MVDVEEVLAEVREKQGPLDSERESEIREDLKFQTAYAGQHAAYIDRWVEREGQWRLERELLVAAEDASEFFAKRAELVALLPPGERSKVRTRFFIKP